MSHPAAVNLGYVEDWVKFKTRREENVTRIKVRLKNGTEEYFPHYVLDHFIKKKGIVAFLRSDGWVYIDRDPVRRTYPPSEAFQGTARRISDQPPKNRFTDHIPGEAPPDSTNLSLSNK